MLKKYPDSGGGGLPMTDYHRVVTIITAYLVDRLGPTYALPLIHSTFSAFNLGLRDLSRIGLLIADFYQSTIKNLTSAITPQ
jgi:hypothetical protein